MSKKKIFLVGMPGAGKTTVGLQIAKKINTPFIDLDHKIEESQGTSIKQIFVQHGESYFRTLENSYLKQIINTIPSFIMATGGGTPCFFDNMNLMNRSGTTIYIQTHLAIINKRISTDSSRPIMQKYRAKDLLKQRDKWYQLAQYTAKNDTEILNIIQENNTRISDPTV